MRKVVSHLNYISPCFVLQRRPVWLLIISMKIFFPAPMIEHIDQPPFFCLARGVLNLDVGLPLLERIDVSAFTPAAN